MSESEIARFNKDVRASEDMQKELAEAGSSLGEIVEFAKSRGYDISVEEVRAHIEANSGEGLSEDQLNGISGGGVVHTHTNVNTNTNVNTAAETSIAVVVEHVAVAAGAPVTIFVS